MFNVLLSYMLFWIVCIFLLTFLVKTKSIKESIDATIPVSFPRTDTLKLPNNMVQGNLEVQGPVVLGIQGTEGNVTYLEANQDQFLFNSSGFNKTSDARFYVQNGLNVQAGNIALESNVKTNKFNANSGQIGTLQVNRSDADPSLGSGIHTLDVYADRTVAAGSNGQVRAWMNKNGDMGSNNVAMLNQVNGNDLTIQGQNILGKIDDLRGNIYRLDERISELKGQHEGERLRRLAEEAKRVAEELRRHLENAGRNLGRAFGL